MNMHSYIQDCIGKNPLQEVCQVVSDRQEVQFNLGCGILFTCLCQLVRLYSNVCPHIFMSMVIR